MGSTAGMLDLYTASRDDLTRIVLEQRDTIARLDARLAQQQREVAADI